MPGCDRPPEPAPAAPAEKPAAPPPPTTPLPAATPPAANPAPQETATVPGAPAVPPDVKAPPATATKTASGMAYRVLQKGKGTRHPKATDTVRVHYSGWTTDGKMFDSSVTRGAPATFPLNGVIAGWTEGLQLMVVGEKRRFWIPEALAYQGRQAPFGTLVFDVELLAIQ